MKDLQNKVAVITGAAEGIGKALAQAAAARGMKLVLADISAERLQATVSEFEQQGVAVLGVVTDVAKESAIQHLADQAYARFGAVHLLINNAGVAVAKSAWETTAQDWEWVMGVNLYGVTHALRIFVPRMLAQDEEAHIVNTASMAGMISAPALAAYNVSKFGVVTLTEGLYHDLTLRQSKIGVSVLCPSWVNTRIVESERNRDAEQRTKVETLEKVSAKTSAAIMKAVENGLAPETVAEQVMQAVLANQFYILTHADSLPAVNVRAQDILQGRQPSLLPI
ncbi:SDR family NAD(P)-dependent oxidoreductase [Undibacterium cyanobacteriorum]|uniref:SDR family NAD(P)-dependent oxidoreductase n=1 Tax=Undibacterium cyanobacteriorum TaxID=3073561 RepID=A0ABY9RFZ1_9BURK|nr:SDR family NAD(P)-dependent oxidoreductase [Undibacterium sp. 20NA77.5]WMW80135.1 SDR family NAD(P)-dependent oxidoreductase [Undibacterium sp. 20NA77.5]